MQLFSIYYGIVISTTLALVLGWASGYRLSFESSMPRGVYRIVPAGPIQGDAVFFTLPKENPYYTLGRLRGQSNAQLRISRLVGIPGDEIKVAHRSLAINGSKVFRCTIHDTDSHGRPLPCFLDSGTIPRGQGLVLSTHDEMSLDGRYFGLLALYRLEKAIPVITF